MNKPEGIVSRTIRKAWDQGIREPYSICQYLKQEINIKTNTQTVVARLHALGIDYR